MKPEITKKEAPSDRRPGLGALVLIASATTFLWYLIYYAVAPYVWAQNLYFPPWEYTLWVRGFTNEHDGVEIYALYLLMFCSIATVFAGYSFYGRICANKIVKYATIVILSAVTCLLLFKVGLHPPVSSASEVPLRHWLISLAYVGAITLAIIYCLNLIEYVVGGAFAATVAGLALIPPCFIAFEPFSWPDYAFIFAPALRLLNGAAPSEVYLQYDLFMSLLPLAWMKLGISPELFYLPGQLSFYGLILVTFLFSRKIFVDKRLPYFLLAAMVLVKIYGGIIDPVRVIQVTPLRLDWWLVFLILVYYKGPYSRIAALVSSLLIIFHHNFGVIYLAAYLQLLATLFLLDVLDARTGVGPFTPLFKGILREHVRKSAANLLAIALSVVIAKILFHGDHAGSVQLFQKIGIGFIQIARASFYWYVIILVALVPTLLFRMRQFLPRNYLVTGYFLVYLGIGNSIYFFGRSHENNIINISGALLFLLFMFIDLLARYGAERTNSPHRFRMVAIVLATLSVLVIVASYGNRIGERVVVQYNKVKKMDFVSGSDVPMAEVMYNLNSVRSVAGDSKKVYFLSFNDFMYYYSGHYSPVGYFNPFMSWVFKKDLVQFLQGLLDQGYYLADDNGWLYNGELTGLHFNKLTVKDNMMIAWKQ